MHCSFRAAETRFKNAVRFSVALVSSFFRTFGGRACRFYPSCSEYAGQALDTAGLPKALGMIFGRVLRCHPFSAGGYDPVSAQPKKED